MWHFAHIDIEPRALQIIQGREENIVTGLVAWIGQNIDREYKEENRSGSAETPIKKIAEKLALSAKDLARNIYFIRKDRGDLVSFSDLITARGIIHHRADAEKQRQTEENYG